MWLKGTVRPQVLSYALPLVFCDTGHSKIFIINFIFFNLSVKFYAEGLTA